MKAQATVRLLVVDLDNTLWDWASIWFESLDGLLREVSASTGIARATLESEARSIHTRVHTSDYELLLDQLPSLRHHFGRFGSMVRSPRKRLDGPMHNYYATRKRLTVPYEGVLATLAEIRARGTRIVGFSESDEFQATLRVKRTGLDGILDEIWVAPDLAVASDKERRVLRTKKAHAYELVHTRKVVFGEGLRKPSAVLLLEICRANNVAPSETAYVGDSMPRDMRMAVDAGTIAVHAKYGAVWPKPQLELLKRVSHWSEADIKLDEELRSLTMPSVRYVLHSGLSELLTLFDFTGSAAHARDFAAQRLTALIELWKSSVEVQKSFNTISWQIRGLGVTAITAAIGAAAVLLKDHVSIQAVGQWVPAGGGVLLMAALLWASLWYMERRWYHRLLVGAGIQAEHLESQLRNELADRRLGLSHDITAASHTVPWIFKRWPKRRRAAGDALAGWWAITFPRRYTKARNRLDYFYLSVGTVVGGGGIYLLWDAIAALFERVLSFLTTPFA